jgi:integrase
MMIGEPLEASVTVGSEGRHKLDNEQFYSREGYLVHLLDRRWKLSKDVDIPILTLDKIFPGDSYTLRHVLAFYARHSSPWHVKNLTERLLHYVKALDGAEIFSVESIISYRASLSMSRAWYLSTIRVFLRQWARLGYPGIPNEALSLLDSFRIKGNEKGRAVQSQCPDEGPLTDVEMLGVVEATTHYFATSVLGLTDTTILLTFAMTGRRPSQVSALKLKDIINLGDKYYINFPRAKQRNMGWRSSFKKFAIVEDVWMLLNEQASRVQSVFAKSLGVDIIPAIIASELPLFPNMKEVLSLAGQLEILKSDRLHIASSEIYRSVVKTGEKINVISERSGQPLHLNPNRFRYTLGTNLAREGMGEYVIAEALDHSDIQNAGVYVKNLPDIVERIDRAVAMQLAPYAQIFPV